MRTLCILKPDATRRNLTGAINSMIEEKGFRIVAQKMITMSADIAEKFYEIHKERSFFNDLVKQMSEGRVVLQVLEREGSAVPEFRKLMGATDPAKADKDTIRKCYALNIGENTVHGSDEEENAAKEIAFFFAECDICK